MIDTIIKVAITVAKIGLALLPFVILCISSKRVNLPQPSRSRQVLMPAVATVYIIVAMLLMKYIDEWLIRLIINIPKWIASIADISWMPEKIGNVFENLGDGLAEILNALNLKFWIFFVSNAVIILVYLILKKICIKIMNKAIKTDGKIHNRISGFFYGYFEMRDCWCLRQEFVQMRAFLKAIYYTSVVLSVVLIYASFQMYRKGYLNGMFYPVFGVILLSELYFYLDGVTRKEYTSDILGEDEDAYKVVNYSLLRKFLRSIFGDKLLSENTGINNTLAYDVTTEQLISELETSEDPKVVAFASYVDALNKKGFKIDHNYLQSSLNLLNGKSILFNNPFYNDLIPYAFYPMNRALLSHQKVLVVLGRHAIEDDIKEWIEKGIAAVTNIPYMWKIGVLNSEEQELDIGIVTRSDVLDIKLHNANSSFLENVGYTVIIEPSKLIPTAQIGLSLLVKKCKADEDKEVVYCLCDKNCDGLVDAMSHILMTSITEVAATNKHLGTSSHMCWEADDEYLHHRLIPNVSRYLGFGTELSFAALKNQVSKTRWFGGEVFPVTDIRWIDKQYYYDLTKYASLPTNQESMDEHFITTPNFWSAEVEQNCYLTVEDESNNMFEVLREFSTRTTEQGFVNVISPEYLLKDYMADNASIFEADAKAIPFIVADFARSNRNTILKLILMMSTFEVSEQILEKELSLLGLKVFDLKKQLWYEIYNCYSPIAKLDALPNDYREAVEAATSQTVELNGSAWSSEIIKCKEAFNLKLGKLETVYYINERDFLSVCVAELRSAGYVSEDEKGERYYLGAELCGHIYQKYLPGQFFTFGGKYYEMQYLTADMQVLVRRAADHIKGRSAYRQIRKYAIQGIKPSTKIGSSQNIAGMKIVKEFADIAVSTPGYYLMKKYNDFETAKRIMFEGEKSGIPERYYRNKEIIRIELPDFDGKFNDKIRYTITLLFNEIFRTIFAENQAYICAVTDLKGISEDEAVQPLTYSVEGEGCEIVDNAIYIIEDSQLDLGLTVSVERNLERILSIVHDYLDWHLSSLSDSLQPPPDPAPPVVITNPEDEEDGDGKGKKRKGIFARIKNAFKKLGEKIKGIFKKKPKDTDGDTPTDGEPTGDTPAEDVPSGDTPSGDTPADGTPEDVTPAEETPSSGENGADDKPEKKGFIERIKNWFRKKKKKTPVEPTDDTPTDDTPADDTPADDTPAEGDGSTEGSGSSEEADTPATVLAPADTEEAVSSNDLDKIAQNGFASRKKAYHERYYLLYGREGEFPFTDFTATVEYLTLMGLDNNALKQAREGKKIAEMVENTFKPGKPDARYCDFCGAEIYGVEYETLADGRDRCLNCGKTAIKTGEEFRKIFEDVKRNMESFYGIKINTGIRVEMVNSKELHKRLGKAFIPTPASDGRVLGVAIKDKNGYSLYVENGSPRMASMLTMAHELTHIWQYLNWNDRAIKKKYGKELYLQIYEGMAKWVEIQYAYLINEPATAKREEIITSYRQDEYGFGFLRYRAQYPFSLGTVITKPTPFMNIETPLGLEYCGELQVNLPTNGINPGDVDGENGPSGTPTGGGKPTGGSSNGEALKGPIDRDSENPSLYCYNLLSEGEKQVYNAVLQAVENYSAELDMTAFETKLDCQQTQSIVEYVRRDYPENIWFEHGAVYVYDNDTNIVNKIKFEYCMTRDEALKRQEKIIAAIEPFVSQIRDDMSDFEVALRIYENIIKLVDYDTIGLEKQKKSVNTDGQPDDLRSVYGVFVNKKAVCAGYAKAMQYLMKLSGIECAYVTSDTHAWNIIKLEGDYYHLDVTWGDSSNTKKDISSNEVNYDCFCITTQEVLKLKAHTPDELMPVPECIATKCNYYRRYGLFFDKFDFNRIRSVICDCIESDKLTVSLKFGSEAAVSEAKTQLVDNGKFREAIQYSSLKGGKKVDSTYQYSVVPEKCKIVFYLKKA